MTSDAQRVSVSAQSSASLSSVRRLVNSMLLLFWLRSTVCCVQLRRSVVRAEAPCEPNTQMFDPEVTTEGSCTVTSRKVGAGGFSTADAGWINVVRASIPAAQAARAARLVAFIMALLHAHG